MGTGMKKKLLIYANYYAPDVASTGQLLTELAEGLADTFDITVVCVVPSYDGNIPKEYRNKKSYKENLNGVNILRLRVRKFDKRSKISRVVNILDYFVSSAIATLFLQKFDYVFTVSTPPVLGGLLGVWGKFITGAKFIYNIQDFNPEAVMAVRYTKRRWLTGLMMFFDKISCKYSDKIIVVGRDMMDTLGKRFNYKNVPVNVCINNWMNEKEVYPLPEQDSGVINFKKKYGLENKFVFMYSGNLGLYYDLKNLMRVIKKFRKGRTLDGEEEQGFITPDGREVVFVFVGSGTIKVDLKKYQKKHHFNNVIFIPYQDKKDLIYSLNSADVHWCVNAKGIKGVCVPSKAYGIMAAGKPIMGVLERGSECERIISESNCGLCCEPGDYAQVEKNIQWFIDNANCKELENMGKNGRRYLEERLTKRVSINKYKEELIDL